MPTTAEKTSSIFRAGTHKDLGSIQTGSDHWAKQKVYNILLTPTDTYLQVIFLKSCIAEESYIELF